MISRDRETELIHRIREVHRHARLKGIDVGKPTLCWQIVVPDKRTRSDLEVLRPLSAVCMTVEGAWEDAARRLLERKRPAMAETG